MNYPCVQDPELDFNERLRMEQGWGDVSNGLAKVLFGYGTLILGTVIGLGMVLISLYGLSDGPMPKGAKPSNFSYWMLYLGLGILSVIGIISYSIIVGGQFKCMMGTPERNGARWLMFMAIACLFFGPAFEIASGIANWQAIQELKKNPAAVRDFRLNPLGQWLHLIGFGITMLYPLCFTLFLRAVAVCLRAETHVMLVNTFTVLAMSLVAATGYMLYQFPPGGKPPPAQMALLLFGGWFVMLILYIALIAVMRGCVVYVTGNLKSPLEV
jgi:hypothetical protein